MDLDRGLAALGDATAYHQGEHPQSVDIPTAVFLHTTWRSGGTWLWSRLCAAPNTIGLYEPLHEALATLKSGQLADWRSDLWASDHDYIEGSYFEAYRPTLRRRGGLAAFPQGFGGTDFFGDERQDHPALRKYLETLLSTQTRGLPILKFCRSMGWLRFMQRHFPLARHIVLVRNPASQWVSMCKQMMLYGNQYFTSEVRRVVTMAESNPQLRLVTRAMRLDRAAGFTRAEHEYRIFLAFWLLAHYRLPPELDAVIHVDILENAPTYRTEAEQQIIALTGLDLDLGPSRPPAALSESLWLDLTADEVLRCHADALCFVADSVDDARLASRLSALLSLASLRASEGEETLHCASARQLRSLADVKQEARTVRDRLIATTVTLTEAERRLRNVTKRLSAIEQSRCWAMTAPIRKGAETLKNLLRGTAPA